MRSLRFVFLLLALTLSAFADTDSAALQKRLGLTVSLTTNRFQVIQQSAGAKPLSFVAGVALTNHSREAVPFTFPDAGSAQRKFVFRIIDAEGEQVWGSEAPPSAQVLTPGALKAGKAWKRTLQIPLTIGGEALATGLYTLEAKLADQEGSLGAYTRFKIVSPWGELDPQTGIAGTVVRLPNLAPAANETVSITELRPTARRPAFNAMTRTDAEGNFSIVAPPGRYRVSAGARYGSNTLILHSSNTSPVNNLQGVSAEATVVAGSFAQVNLTLPALPPLPPEFGPPPTGFTVQFWPDYTSDDIVVEVTSTFPTGGYASRLAYLHTTDDGVARLAYGVRIPTGGVTLAFETKGAVQKIPRTPGLHQVQVNGVPWNLPMLPPAQPLSPDTGIDIVAVQAGNSGDVPFANQKVTVTPLRFGGQQYINLDPDGQPQVTPRPAPFLWEGVTGEDGRISLDVPYGVYFVTLTWNHGNHSGTATYQVSFAVEPGERQAVTLRKEPGGEVYLP